MKLKLGSFVRFSHVADRTASAQGGRLKSQHEIRILCDNAESYEALETEIKPVIKAGVCTGRSGLMLLHTAKNKSVHHL